MNGGPHPDSLRVKIVRDNPSHGQPGEVMILSWTTARKLVDEGIAIPTDEAEPGTVGTLLKYLAKRPSNLADCGFAIGMDFDDCEALLKRLVAHGQIAKTAGSSYSAVYWKRNS